MTVPSEVSKSGPYNGNGSTTVFAYGFRVVSASHLRVVRVNADLTETVLTLNTNYTVSGVGNVGGGNVTITPAPATWTKIVILRNVPFTQETDLENQGAYYADTVEGMADLATMRDQQLAELASRALKVPASYGPGSGDAMIGDVIRIVQSADNIDVVANNIGDVNTVADNIASVNTVSAIAADVMKVATIDDAVSAVAAIDDQVVDVAVIKFDVATVAGVASSVSTVAGIAPEVNAVGDNIPAVVTVATNLGDVTNFSDVYLGPKESDPSTRNDGSPLVEGDLYFNTTTDVMRVYGGGGWASFSGSGGVVDTVEPGTGITVDASTPSAPVVAVDYLDKIVTVPSITALKSLDTTKYKWAFLFHAHRWGFFQWSPGDFSTYVSADTAEGIFVKADAIAATSGAWQRVGDWRTSGIYASWFGVVADSAGTTGSGTDNTGALSAAVSLLNTFSFIGAASLILPAGIIRFGSQVTVQNKAIRIIGAGMGLPDAWPDPIIPSRSTGTWLYFDHTGIGIRFQDGATNPQWASRVEGVTTMRNQPTPAPGWSPTVHGADFSMSLHSVHFENVGTLNPYLAFDMNRAPCSFNHIRGQPLRTFAAVDNTGDVCRWNDVHLWPYWSLSEYVATYTRSSLWIFDLGRADNAQLSNIFSIRQAIGIRAWAGTGVGPQRLKGTNVEFDQGGSGLVVSDGTSGLVMQFTNFVTYIEASLAANTRGIQVEGTNHNIQINGLDVSNSGANAVLVQGTNNKLGICNYRLYNYGENTTDAPGIYVAGTGNRIVLEGSEDVSSPNSTVKYFTTGTDCAIVRDDWRAYTPAITASTGSITTVSSVVGRFRRNLKSVDFHVRFVMSNNGTGAGKLRVSLPEAAANPSMVTGIQVNNGYALSGDIAAGNTYAEVVKYDGTYPGVNSTVVIVSGTYSVA